MDKHSKTYEQFCFVKQKNIVMEETIFYSGKRSVVCLSLDDCNRQGGCTNTVLRHLWENDENVVNKCKNDKG